MLDGELRQWHLGFGVEWVGAVVVMALLQKCVVCGLGADRSQWVGRAGGGQWVGRVPGHPVPDLVANTPAVMVPSKHWEEGTSHSFPLLPIALGGET